MSVVTDVGYASYTSSQPYIERLNSGTSSAKSDPYLSAKSPCVKDRKSATLNRPACHHLQRAIASRCSPTFKLYLLSPSCLYTFVYPQKRPWQHRQGSPVLQALVPLVPDLDPARSRNPTEITTPTPT